MSLLGIRTRSGRSFFSLFFLCVVLLIASGTSSADNPSSRPILFAHGFCGNPFDFQPLLGPLYQQLPPNLYPSPTIYYVLYDSVANQITFYLLQNGGLVAVSESSIPDSTRFFSIIFYDPVSKSTDPADVAKISVLNKAYELSQAIRHITAITRIKDVIVVGHSMGGLDARTYVENLASAGACYDYQNNDPAYGLDSCAPGSGNAAFAHDVGDIVSVDTPHAGSPLAVLNLGGLGGCIAESSTTRYELTPEGQGGSGLFEVLNYNGLAVHYQTPSRNETPVQAVQDWFSDVTNPWDNYGSWLSGYSDDVVLSQSQSIALNLPLSDTDAPLADVAETYLSSDSGIAGTDACWVLGIFHEPMLHFMSCLGAQPNTQNAIATQINAHTHGSLTKITVIATLNGNAWSGAVAYQVNGPSGTKNETAVPVTISDVRLGTYSVTYQSGGPGSNGPPSIVASPGATLQSGVWAITFTLQFSTETSQVTTLAASSLTASSATLNGTVNPEGDNGYAGFFWGTDPHLNTYNLSCTSWYYCASVTPNSNTQSFTANLGSLSANTTYYYRMVFYDTSNGGYQYGDIVSFTTDNPTVTTRSATGLTASGAAMNGSIDPEGANGYAGFYWGTDPNLNTYNLSCTYWYYCASVTANFTAQSFTSTLSGLTSGTTYYYRMVFNDTDNRTFVYGAIRSFTTKTPIVTTSAVSSLTSSGAVLNGRVNPEGANGYAGFYWGTDPNMNTYNLSCTYWYECAQVTANYTTQPFSASLSGLASNTIYYYQMVFYDTDNRTYQYGPIRSFTTRTPVMTTSAASSITSSGGTMNGKINPEGANGYAGFYWGTDPNMNTYSLSCTYWYECAQVTANYTTQSFSATLSGLASNTIYYYQMVFYDTDNRTYQYGAIRSFTTRTPIMTTSAASSVTSSGGTMNGKINPEGANGYAGFYWGTDPQMNTYTLSCTYWYQCAQVTANYTTQSFSAVLSGLASNTTYYYQMVFNNTDNHTLAYGAIKSFTTKNPTVSTLAATSITGSGATMNGEVDPRGANGYVGFYWSTDPNMNTYNLSCTYWYECATVVANFVTQSFSSGLSGLSSNTTYYYREVFNDTDNNSYKYGSIHSFTTQ